MPRLIALPTKPARTRLMLAVAGGLFGLVAALLLNTLVPPTALREDMTGPYFVYGVYDPEAGPQGVTYRWTTPHATLTFPYAANLGRYAQVSIRLAGNRPPGEVPARVAIGLN